MFHQMHIEGVMPDTATFVTVFSMLDGEGCLQGTRMHTCLLNSGLKFNVVIETALVGMYSRCGSFEKARKVFNAMTGRNVVSWTTLISAYSRSGYGQDALLLFQEMQTSGLVPNEITYISLLHACACDLALLEGRLLHACIIMEGAFRREITLDNAFIEKGFGSNIAMDNALVTMYCKCTNLQDGWAVFRTQIGRDVVSWTAILALCVKHGHCRDAFWLFNQMQVEGLLPDRVAFISMLDACVLETSITEGKRMHLYIISSAIFIDVVLGTALVYMYGKCGKSDEAAQVFDNMACRNSVTWNAMIAGHAQHGKAEKALHIFNQMLLANVSPDIVTFSSILSVCNHAGLVEEGCKYALKMREHYKIRPSVEHYNCLVGLLGRVGLVKAGETLISCMPIQPTTSCWAALLSSLQAHENLGQGKDAADHVFELNPEIELLCMVAPTPCALFDGQLNNCFSLTSI